MRMDSENLHPHQTIGTPLEDQHHFQLFAVNAMDMVWSSRNRVVHERIGCEAKDLALPVRKLSSEHRVAWRQNLEPTSTQPWQPPL